MTRHVYTEKDKEAIQKLYAEGHGSPYIAKVIGVGTSAMADYISRHYGLRSAAEANKKYHCDEDFFNVIDTESKAYWLGFMYADGFIQMIRTTYTVGLTLAASDKAHLQKFKETINATNPIKTYIPSKNTTNYTRNPYSKLVITSEMMYKALARQGAIEHKTNKLQAPTELPASFIHHFIRGYFDGDGSLTKSVRHSKTRKDGTHPTEYAIKILGTKSLLDFIKTFVEKNEVAKINKYFKRKKNQTVSSLEFSGRCQVKHFMDLLYADAHVFLKRKHDRYLELCCK